uniref:Uncharacterized protein n=1 Tax=Meloidogyne enterolobii TaxID=390850 RepID=A0A6V7XUP0_MELEN|nr:unnamed protein product [Meloidogyne enterolobii]
MRTEQLCYCATTAPSIYLSCIDQIHLPIFSLKNNYIFGCGLIYPPTIKMSYEKPFMFFTKNGEHFGKCIKIEVNDSYKPFVQLSYCSVETNFGNNLETIPFKYDISKPIITYEFY